MKKKIYICLVKDEVSDEYSLGQGLTTNLEQLKELRGLLKRENVDCKIFELKEIS